MIKRDHRRLLVKVSFVVIVSVSGRLISFRERRQWRLYFNLFRPVCVAVGVPVDLVSDLVTVSCIARCL